MKQPDADTNRGNLRPVPAPPLAANEQRAVGVRAETLRCRSAAKRGRGTRTEPVAAGRAHRAGGRESTGGV